MFKKASAAFLIVMLMAALLTGCGKINASKNALTVNGETVSTGTASTYVRYQQAETYSQMVSWGFLQEGSEYWNSMYDEETGQTYGDYIVEATKEDLTNMVLLRQHAEEYNVALTDEETAAISEAAAKFISDNGSVAKWIGADQASVENMLSLYTYKTKMRAPMVADVDTEVSDEEAAQSSVIYFRLTLTKPSDYEGTDEEYKSEAKAQMERLLNEAKEEVLTSESESETVDDAEAEEESEAEAEEADEDVTVLEDELVLEEDDEAVLEEETTITDKIESDKEQYSTLASSINESIYVTSYSCGKDGGSLEEAVWEKAKDLSDGEFYNGVIETESYLYLVRMEAAFDEEATATEKDNIIADRQDAAYDELLQSWKDAADISIGNGWDQIIVTDQDNYVVKS